MALGTALFLIAIGAVLRYAVTAEVSGIKIETVGGILMVVGIIGLVITLAQMIIASRRPDAADRVVEREYDQRPTTRL
jgi:sulfite exporter TauE/SafE